MQTHSKSFSNRSLNPNKTNQIFTPSENDGGYTHRPNMKLNGIDRESYARVNGIQTCISVGLRFAHA